MLLFYIRHGDPTYKPDELTPLGKRQAEALAKRLSLYGIDEIYASTSNRAIETALPTCEILQKELKVLDFANEKHAAKAMVIENESGRHWIFRDKGIRMLFGEESVYQLGFEWYKHPRLIQYSGLGEEMERVYRETDTFWELLGMEHIHYSGTYKINVSNEKRVALFAHQGFGMAFMSCLLDIPYPQFCRHFDFCHSGMTVIQFRENEGYAIPCVLTHSSDSHLYREGLPTLYNKQICF